jgi:hypothetical protein
MFLYSDTTAGPCWVRASLATATFDVRAEGERRLDLRIFLEVDFQETPGCPTLPSRTSILALRA